MVDDERQPVGRDQRIALRRGALRGQAFNEAHSAPIDRTTTSEPYTSTQHPLSAMTVEANQEDEAQQEAEALAFARPLDVHRWSEYPEANLFVDEVYARCVQGKRTDIERKHLKVVLLDLYVASLEHPDLKLVVPMSTGAQN